MNKLLPRIIARAEALSGKGYKKTLQGVGNILYLGGHYMEIHEYMYKICNHWTLYLRVYFMHFNLFVLPQLQNRHTFKENDMS